MKKQTRITLLFTLLMFRFTSGGLRRRRAGRDGNAYQNAHPAGHRHPGSHQHPCAADQYTRSDQHPRAHGHTHARRHTHADANRCPCRLRPTQPG